jgi:hypothetical protein
LGLSVGALVGICAAAAAVLLLGCYVFLQRGRPGSRHGDHQLHVSSNGDGAGDLRRELLLPESQQ